MIYEIFENFFENFRKFRNFAKSNMEYEWVMQMINDSLIMNHTPKLNHNPYCLVRMFF